MKHLAALADALEQEIVSVHDLPGQDPEARLEASEFGVDPVGRVASSEDVGLVDRAANREADAPIPAARPPDAPTQADDSA